LKESWKEFCKESWKGALKKFWQGISEEIQEDIYLLSKKQATNQSKIAPSPFPLPLSPTPSPVLNSGTFGNPTHNSTHVEDCADLGEF
jgi:hypothetical protein